MNKRTFLAVLLISFMAVNAFSSPPLDPEYLKNKPEGFRPCRTMTSDQIKSLQYKGAIRKSGLAGLAQAKTYNVLVIRVDFPNNKITKTKAQTEAFLSQMKDYYLENSYGLVTITATVTSSTYTLGSINNYNDETDAKLLQLKADAIAAAAADGISFALYDHIMIYHAGCGEEESGETSDIWSLYYPAAFIVGSGGNTKTFLGFTIVPELTKTASNSPLGVICHEYGHQLGLPDLYNTAVSGGASTCGCWSLMDYPYGFDNTGANPPHLDPWCKYYLQWIDPSNRVISASSSNLEMLDIESSQSNGFFKIPVEVGTSNEYFLIEYRSPDAAKVKYDMSLPGSGVLIWHIDDTIALNTSRLANNDVNSGSPNKAVDLVEADGNTSAYPPGKASNAFTGGSLFINPQSNAFNGIASGITLAGFTLTKPNVVFTATKLTAADTISVCKLTNYPNPAGPGFAHPRSGMLTTISVNLTRPTADLDLLIYNISGELVKSISGSGKFSLRINASTDGNWVYECDWDGKNDSGEDVAPGVYFYIFKSGLQKRTGKMAIIR